MFTQFIHSVTKCDSAFFDAPHNLKCLFEEWVGCRLGLSLGLGKSKSFSVDVIV